MPKTFREKLQDRINFLVFAADFDYTEPINAVMFTLMASVLMENPNYLQETHRLAQLNLRLPTEGWIILLLVIGMYALVMCLLGGIPALFASTPRANLHWYIARTAGFVAATMLTGFIAILFTLNGFSWGTVLLGVPCALNLFSCWRTGKLMSADREYLRLKAQAAKGLFVA